MKILRQILLFFMSCLLASYGFGQSQQSFDECILETQKYLNQYASLTPFDENCAIARFELSADEIEEFWKEAGDDAIRTENKDSIDCYYMIEYYQEAIIANLNKLILHDEFTKNDITARLKLEDTDLSIIVSEDRKLYNFSLDAKTGGTYRSRISFMHYVDIKKENLPSQEAIDKGLELSPYAVFEGDGFNGIYSINTKEGIKYVLTGDVRGCSYCFETNIMLVEFEEGSFQSTFFYSVNSRTWEGGVVYHPGTKIITVDYNTDDLTTDCDCMNYAQLEEEEYSYYDDNEDVEPVEKQCHCTFEFNGFNFELTKECREKVKE